MLRGGGVAFGPKPRDFATGLPRRVYDAAWRGALSYRYRKGELVVVDSLGIPQEGIEEGKAQFWMHKWMETLGWDRRAKGSVLITSEETPANASLYQALNKDLKKQGMVRPADGVDVKNVLSMGRIVIEWSALNKILQAHAPKQPIRAARGLTTRATSDDLLSGFDQAMLQETAVNFDQYDMDQETEDVEDVLAASEVPLDDLDDIYDLAGEEVEPPRARA